MKILSPPPAAGNQQLPGGINTGGVDPNPMWRPNSAEAREAVLSHADRGGNLMKGQPGAMKAKDLMSAVGDPNLSVQSAQGALARLRSIMEANGINPQNYTRAQLEKMFDKLPPAYFSGPAIATGGLGLMASEWPDRQ